MANEMNSNMDEQGLDPKAEKARLKEERKQLKAEQKAQKKKAKQKKKELDDQAADLDDDEGGGFGIFIITVLIIIMWLGIMCLLIKLDVGGFGSNVLKPIIGNVPYLNMILPSEEDTATNSAVAGSGDSATGGAVDSAYVTKLEKALQEAQSQNSSYSSSIEKLQAEVDRLTPFEQEQSTFNDERNQFYEEIVYNDNAPDASAYASYYAMIEPDAAASIYAGVVAAQVDDDEVTKYAATYSSMKPKQAAAIFDAMDDLTLVARILKQMSADDRGAILGLMDTTVADKVTKLMEPDKLPYLSSNSTTGSDK